MNWLIGNRGMLGSDVEKTLKENNMDFIATDLEVDITDFDKLQNFTKNKNINWIINCSAYTLVDKAEDQPELAFKINAEGVLNIARIAKDLNSKLIHISTDYVYDGKKENPYVEEDKTNPLGVYGKSKLEGEKNIINVFINYFIIRTAWLYGQNGNNFVYTMLRLFKNNNVVKVVSDQWGSPTYTKDLAQIILNIIKNKSINYGVYHFTNNGKTNWWEFAKEIYLKAKSLKLIDRAIDILPIKTEEYPTKAIRPKNSYLSKEKIKKVLDVDIRNWKNALDDFLYEIKQKGIRVL